MKDPADYRPASNSYPSQLYGGMNDAPGPSELVRSLGIRFALRILSFISGTYIGNSTDRRRRGGPKKKRARNDETTQHERPFRAVHDQDWNHVYR